MFFTPRPKTCFSLVLCFSMIASALKPAVGGFVELKSYLYGRDQALFRKADNNREVLLAKGTRGIIRGIKTFTDKNGKPNGNQGLCLETVNIENYSTSERENDCVWVYYGKGRKEIQLIEPSAASGMDILSDWLNGKKVKATLLKEAKDTDRAVAAETQREIPAIPGNASDGDTPVAPATKAARTARPANPQSGTDFTPQLEGRIETVNSLNDGKHNRTQNRECVECRNNVVKYETCKPKNSYFETILTKQQLGGSFTGDMIRSNPPTLIRPACVHEALTHKPPKMVACSSGSVRGKRGSPTPCLSENYERLIANSVNTVSHCMKSYIVQDTSLQNQTVLSIFNMMTWESSLHPHAVSSGNAGGMGQLTYNAIEDVNNNRLGSMREHLQNHADPLCQKLGALALAPKAGKPPIRSGLSKSCDRVNMAEGSTNPATNLLYTMAYQTITRDAVTRNFFGRHSAHGKVFAEMKASDRNWLIDQLAIWSHNTGPGGLLVPLDALLDCHSNLHKAGLCSGPIRKVTNPKDFLQKLEVAMMKRPHPRNYLNRKQNSHYYKLLRERSERVQEQAGGLSCLAG
jgi:hypothetical protein